MTRSRHAILYRMVLPDHTCPYGVRAKQMLEDASYQVEDRLLRTREEVDDFEAENGVTTTPQIFIDGKRVGGSTELQDFLAGTTEVSPAEPESTSLGPIRRKTLHIGSSGVTPPTDRLG
jgi:glutaredoxin 3